MRRWLPRIVFMGAMPLPPPFELLGLPPRVILTWLGVTVRIEFIRRVGR